MFASQLAETCVSGPVVLAAASEGRNNLEKEVTRLEQLNRDVKSACQELQATVDDLAR